MHLISAVVRPVKVDEICEALQTLGFRGFTATEASGFGKLRERPEIYRGAEYASQFQRHVKLEIVVLDEDVVDVVEVIRSAASTGAVGDGKLWVTPVSDVVRLRTGERGRDAL